MVFPLGMYTAATFRLAKALGFAFLLVITQYFVYVAPTGWVIVFVELLHDFVPGLRGRRVVAAPASPP